MEHRVTLNGELQHNPFVVPENYFGTFSIRKSVVLNSALKQNVFAAPKGYFDTLQAHIVEAVANAKRSSSVLRWQPLRAQLAFAASFALLIALGYGVFSFLRPAATATEKNYAGSFPSYLSQIIDEPVLIHAVANDSEHAITRLHPAVAAMDNDAIIRYLADADVSLNDIAATY
ncbi:MAG: hypothetical protein LBN98_01555 [Prevotellaceae bacterium]|jgi:hypothetical protein|nr:hypothetical protein [Prevotellaceae bacterium]